MNTSNTKTETTKGAGEIPEVIQEFIADYLKRPLAFIKERLYKANDKEYFAIEGMEALYHHLTTSSPSNSGGFQSRVDNWMQECFGEEISKDRMERNHRFIEEALELVQANGVTKSECLQLVEYVFGRPAGELKQEVGGVIVTLSALCSACDISMNDCGETELERIWNKIDKIREKQAAKPKHSPLPQFPQPQLVSGVRTKEEILKTWVHRFSFEPTAENMFRANVLKAMEEYATQFHPTQPELKDKEDLNTSEGNSDVSSVVSQSFHGSSLDDAGWMRLIDAAFVAGRSKTSWEQFKLDHNL